MWIKIGKIDKIICTAAIICLTVFLSACGGAGDKLYKESVSLYEEGSYEEAEKTIIKAIKSNGDNSDYYVCYGMILVGLGDYEGAREQFLHVISDKNSTYAKENNKKAYRGIALSYFDSGVYDQAKAYFELALGTDVLSDMDNDLKAYRAECEMYLGNYDNAVKEFTELIENQKGMSKDEVKGIYISRGNAYMILGNYMAASEDYGNVIDMDEYSYTAYIGKYLALTGTHDKDAAVSVLDKAFELECRNSEDEYYNAVLRYYKGDYEKAMEVLEKCKEAGIKEAGLYIGMICQNEGKYSEALEYYSIYINEVPSGKNAELCNQVAGCYEQLEDYSSAKTWIDEAVGKAGGSMLKEVLKNRIIIYERLGKYKKAKQFAEEYIETYDDMDMLSEYEYIKTRYRNSD